MHVIDAIEELEQASEKTWNPPARAVFHYTTLEGALGILKSGVIWATHYLDLNDPGELKAGEEIVADAMREYISQPGTDGRARAYLQLAMGDYAERSLTKKVADIYVASFSDDPNGGGDILSQWRLYAANGGGASLGVTINMTDDLGSDPDFMRTFVSCTYDGDTIRNDTLNALRTLTDGACQLEKHVHADDLTQFEDGVRNLYLRRLAAISVRFKHGSYSHERECRLIVLPRRGARDGSVHLRGNTSYVETPIGVTEIVLGPVVGPNEPHAEQLERLAITREPAIRVQRSTLPYRPTRQSP